MADLRGAYDPDAALPKDRDPFPAGPYKLELTESDIVPTKAGTGTLFKFTAQVVDGEHKDRLLWGQMNLVNDNPVAQEIGNSEFRALREATGVLAPDDTADLHYKAFDAIVNIEPAKGEFKAKNQINWRKTADIAAGKTVVPDGKADAADKPAANDNKPTTAKARPWGKKAA